MQACCNIINLLGKAAGGNRCICTMPSIHRLSTRIDHVEESEWNASFAHKDDTAQAGSSCLLGAEKRLVDQEAMVLLRLDVLVLLWDAAKFYDHIEYENLVESVTNSSTARSGLHTL